MLLAAGRVRYRDGGSGATTDLRLDQAALDTTSGGATANLGLAGSLDGKPLRASGRLGALDAVLAGHGTPLTLTALALTLAGSDLAGSASLHLGGDRPRLEAELTARHLDPRDLLPPGADPAPPAGATALFPTTPLPLAELDRLDLQLHLRADSVATPALALDGVELTAALAAGRLKVAPLRFALMDRPVQGELEADAAPARLAVRLAGDDVDLGRLLAALAHTTLVEGRGDFRLQLEGHGASPHALAATAAGRASVLMGPGRLPGQLLSGLAGGVRQLLGDLTAAGKAEPAGLRCAALDARAEAGVARLDLLLDTAYSTVVGGGTVDLGAERVDLTLTPQSKAVDLDLAVPVTIRGPLIAPSFGVAEADAARRVASLLGAVFFPPAALGAFVDLGSAKGNGCLELAAHPERLAAPPRARHRWRHARRPHRPHRGCRPPPARPADTQPMTDAPTRLTSCRPLSQQRLRRRAAAQIGAGDGAVPAIGSRGLPGIEHPLAQRAAQGGPGAGQARPGHGVAAQGPRVVLPVAGETGPDPGQARCPQQPGQRRRHGLAQGRGRQAGQLAGKAAADEAHHMLAAERPDEIEDRALAGGLGREIERVAEAERVARQPEADLHQRAHRQRVQCGQHRRRQRRVEADALGRQHAQRHGDDDMAGPQPAGGRRQLDLVARGHHRLHRAAQPDRQARAEPADQRAVAVRQQPVLAVACSQEIRGIEPSRCPRR